MVVLEGVCDFIFVDVGKFDIVYYNFGMKLFYFCIVWLISVMIANLVCGSRMTAVGCRNEILLRSCQADVITLGLF